MSEDQVDDIPENASQHAPTEQATAASAGAAPSPAKQGEQLSGLMADAPNAPAAKPNVDLDAEAMRAAEAAIVEGERALASASEQLAREQRESQQKAPVRGRELALRLLLAVNVLAMVVVAMLPDAAAVPAEQPTQPVEQAPPEVPPAARMSEPYNQALVAADSGDYTSAITLLERYLADSPGMAPSQKLSVLTALSFYASRNNDDRRALEYTRRAQALEQSHSLPEDLVKDAQAAMASGDQEQLRRIWARFLLQQRQVPSWLYQHVAQAYLELGDSYRSDADAAAAAAHERELAEAAARLRAEAMERQETPR